MQASIVDLRYKTNDILAALNHGEEVVLLYHGKPKGTISPLPVKQTKSVCNSPFFGMNAQHTDESVDAVMEQIRGLRYDFRHRCTDLGSAW